MNQAERENFALTLMDQVERDLGRLLGTIRRVYGWHEVHVTRPKDRKVILITGFDHPLTHVGEQTQSTFMISLTDLGSYAPTEAARKPTAPDTEAETHKPGDYDIVLG
jgi:hypothetical protein